MSARFSKADIDQRGGRELESGTMSRNLEAALTLLFAIGHEALRDADLIGDFFLPLRIEMRPVKTV